MVAEAKDAFAQRVQLSSSACDRFMFIFESIFRLFTCGQNKWSKIVNQGMKEIKGELDIFNFMRHARMTKATVNGLTTFNQRRLLEAQVETSFLLTPFKGWNDKESKAEAKRQKRKEESSDEHSEEDFHFLTEALKHENELDEVTQRLLSGII